MRSVEENRVLCEKNKQTNKPDLRDDKAVGTLFVFFFWGIETFQG